MIDTYFAVTINFNKTKDAWFQNSNQSKICLKVKSKVGKQDLILRNVSGNTPNMFKYRASSGRSIL